MPHTNVLVHLSIYKRWVLVRSDSLLCLVVPRQVDVSLSYPHFSPPFHLDVQALRSYCKIDEPTLHYLPVHLSVRIAKTRSLMRLLSIDANAPSATSIHYSHRPCSDSHF